MKDENSTKENLIKKNDSNISAQLSKEKIIKKDKIEKKEKKLPEFQNFNSEDDQSNNKNNNLNIQVQSSVIDDNNLDNQEPKLEKIKEDCQEIKNIVTFFKNQLIELSENDSEYKLIKIKKTIKNKNDYKKNVNEDNNISNEENKNLENNSNSIENILQTFRF